MGGSKFNAIDPSMGAEALIFFSIWWMPVFPPDSTTYRR